jgi:hypothetical protein
MARDQSQRAKNNGGRNQIQNASTDQNNQSRMMEQGARYNRDSRRRSPVSGYGTSFEAQDDAYMQGVSGDTQEPALTFTADSMVAFTTGINGVLNQ